MFGSLHAAQNVNVQVNDTTGVVWRPASFNTFLVPAQTGHAGKFLTTDGTTSSWAVVTGGGGGSTYLFTASDFNESGAEVSLDYTNGQKATSLIPGFLSAADWIAFNAKAPTASPTFTGTPVAPTAAVDTNTTQLATTAFVIGQSYLKAATAATTYQPVDSDLSAISVLTTTSFGRGLLAETSASTLRTTLALVPGTDFLAFPTGTPTGAKFLRDDNSWQVIPGGGDALQASPLSQFAATTSAQLAGVLSDEAGSSGGFVRAGYLGTAAVEAATAFQAADSDLTTYANITPSANVQSLLGAANYAAMRTQLSLVPGTHVQVYDADLDYLSSFTPAANVKTILNAADFSAIRTALSLVPGTHVQVFDADLATWAAITPGLNVPTFLATPSSANLFDAITNETGTGVLVGNSDPVILAPNAALGALVIDVTKRNNTKTATAAHTFTFSGTPSAGQTFGLTLTGDSVDRVITIPSSYSLTVGAAITTFTLKASAKVELSWRYDGTTYFLAGDPVTFNDLATVTPVTADLIPLYDVSGGVEGKATIATILALAGSFNDPTFTGNVTSSGANITPANAMGAFAIDVTKALNTKTISAPQTFTFSGTPANANTWFSLVITNSDGSAVTATIPSSYSLTSAGPITTVSVPGSGKVHLTWRYDGSAYQVYGAPGASGAGDALTSDPLSQFAATTSAELSGVLSDETGSGAAVFGTSPTLTTPSLSGIITSNGASVTTENALGAFVIDVTKGVNTKTIAADQTFTFSGTPATAKTWFSLEVTNSDSSDHTATIPSSIPYGTSSASPITTVTVPASSTVLLTWQYTGSAYRVAALTTTASSASDTAFASSWNGVTTVAPTKNAVYDILHVGDTDDDGKPDVLDLGTAGIVRTTSGGVISSAELSGDITTSASNATTLATVNSNVGTFGSTTNSVAITVNAKGLVTAVSNQTISGSGGGSLTKNQWTATQSQPPVSAYSVFGQRNGIAYQEFIDGADTSAVFPGILPEGTSLTTGLRVIIKWVAGTANADDCVWVVAWERCNTDTDSDSFATGISATTTTSGTSGIINTTTVDFNGTTEIDGLTVGDMFRIKVTRDGDAGGDTMTGTAQIYTLEVRQR